MLRPLFENQRLRLSEQKKHTKTRPHDSSQRFTRFRDQIKHFFETHNFLGAVHHAALLVLVRGHLKLYFKGMILQYLLFTDKICECIMHVWQVRQWLLGSWYSAKFHLFFSFFVLKIRDCIIVLRAKINKVFCCSGQIVKALDSGSNDLGLSIDWGYCPVFLCSCACASQHLRVSNYLSK